MYLNRRLRIFLALALAAGAAVPAVLQILNPGFSAGFSRLPLWSAGLPFLAYLLIYWIDALRLRLILKPFGISLSASERIVNGILGVFYSNITPMAAGGQPFQVYHLIRRGAPPSVAGSVILVRFAEYLLLSMLVSLGGAAVFFRQIIELGQLFPGGTALFAAGLGIYFFVTLLFLIMVLFPRSAAALLFRLPGVFGGGRITRLIRRRILEVRRALLVMKGQAGKQLLADFLLGGVNLLLQAGSLWGLLEILSPGATGFAAVFTGFVLLNSVAYFIPTPGGSGGIEGLYTLFFTALAGTDTGAAVIVWRLGSYYFHLGLQMIILVLSARSSDNANSYADVVL